MSPQWIIFSRTLEPQMMVWISNHWQSYSIIFNPFNLQELPTTLWPKISCVSRGTLKSTRMNTRRSRTFTLSILDTKKRNCQLWSQQVSSMFGAENENLKPPAKSGKCFSLSSFIAMSHEANWAKIASNQAKCPFWTSMTMTVSCHRHLVAGNKLSIISVASRQNRTSNFICCALIPTPFKGGDVTKCNLHSGSFRSQNGIYPCPYFTMLRGPELISLLLLFGKHPLGLWVVSLCFMDISPEKKLKVPEVKNCLQNLCFSKLFVWNYKSKPPPVFGHVRWHSQVPRRRQAGGWGFRDCIVY